MPPPLPRRARAQEVSVGRCWGTTDDKPQLTISLGTGSHFVPGFPARGQTRVWGASHSPFASVQLQTLVGKRSGPGDLPAFRSLTQNSWPWRGSRSTWGITPFQELQGQRGSLPFPVPQTLVWSPSRLISGQARGEHGIAELAEKACVHGKHRGSPWRQTAGQMQVSF